MMKKNLLSIALTALLFSGCAATVKTPYETPEINIPDSFQQHQKTKYTITLNDERLDRWWTLFADEKLNRLVEQVLEKNSNLAVAGINLKQARLQAGLQKNQQGIRTNVGVSTGHSIDLNSGDDSSNGLSVNAGVSYELDLFGKLAKQSEASQWEAIATEQDLQATAQSLIAETVKLYWQLAYLHEREHYAQLNLETSKKLLSIVQAQFKAGAVSQLELTQAQHAVESQYSNISQIKQQLIETRTALAVLLHQPLQELSLDEPTHLAQIQLIDISAGLPASLLSRRPDLQAAEYRLRKALATKDATTASYYPSISLTGSLGSRSTSLIELIQNPALALGASLNLPFLQVNDMKKNLAISDLEYEKTIIQYRQTLYQAFADVEKALANRTEINHQVELNKKTLELSEKAQQLTEVRYKHGAIALKNVLDAQQNTRSAYLTWLQSKQSQYNAYVTLFQALGGSPIIIENPLEKPVDEKAVKAEENTTQLDEKKASEDDVKTHQKEDKKALKDDAKNLQHDDKTASKDDVKTHQKEDKKVSKDDVKNLQHDDKNTSKEDSQQHDDKPTSLPKHEHQPNKEYQYIPLIDDEKQPQHDDERHLKRDHTVV